MLQENFGMRGNRGSAQRALRARCVRHAAQVPCIQFTDVVKCGEASRSWQKMKTKLVVISLAELREEKRAAILDLVRRHGARNLRVYGSVARGEATRDSDLDLLVSRTCSA